VPLPPHDEAVHRVGRLLFGEGWIDELSPTEFALGKLHADREGRLQRLVRGEPFPDDAKDAIAAARATARFRSWSAQFSEVRRWLYDQGIDCSLAETFDSNKFEEWFATKLGDYEKSATVKRQASVRKLFPTMNPGRGGTDWNTFCDAVRKDSGQHFDNKTIERDVRTIRAAS
jgi:hypothetical protein